MNLVKQVLVMTADLVGVVEAVEVAKVVPLSAAAKRAARTMLVVLEVSVGLDRLL